MHEIRKSLPTRWTMRNAFTSETSERSTKRVHYHKGDFEVAINHRRWVKLDAFIGLVDTDGNIAHNVYHAIYRAQDHNRDQGQIEVRTGAGDTIHRRGQHVREGVTNERGDK